MESFQKKIQDLRKLSVLLDSKFEGPFGIRFGLDAIIGLLPFGGDVITSAVSFYIISEAALHGCPPFLIFRMVLNVFWENIIGVIPFFGNLFDFYWKSNNKNIALMEAYAMNPKRVETSSKLLILFIILCFILLLVGLGWSSYQILMMLKHTLS